MARLYDHIRAHGLMDSDRNELASMALSDLRGPFIPVLAVDNAVDLWFAEQRQRERQPWLVVPYFPTMFIDARFRPSFKDLLPGGPDAPDEIGLLALRSDLWQTMGPVAAGRDKGEVAREMVMQRIADSPNGEFLPMEQRVTDDAVRWAVDFHLFLWRQDKTVKPVGPVVSLTGFLRPEGLFARDMNDDPFLRSLIQPIERDREADARVWVDALLFGVAVGRCANMSIVEMETPPRLSDAFRRRHGAPLCNPIMIVPQLAPETRALIDANGKPELSQSKLDLRPGWFSPGPDGAVVWLTDEMVAAVAPEPDVAPDKPKRVRKKKEVMAQSAP